MRTLVRILRGVACVLLWFAAYGWLDLLRHLPGPHLPLVLPLRANGGADDVSILTVLVVFGATFAAMARIAPPRPSHALRSSLVRGALVAGFAIVVGALQQGLVDQSQLGFAWSGTLSLAWPWIAAVCAAVATFVAAPRETRQPVIAPPADPTPDPPAPDQVADETRPLETSLA